MTDKERTTCERIRTHAHAKGHAHAHAQTHTRISETKRAAKGAKIGTDVLPAQGPIF